MDDDHLESMKVPKTLRNRLNVKEFRKTLKRPKTSALKRSYDRFARCFAKTSSEDDAWSSASVVDQMLTYSPHPLPTSLIKMKRHERKQCTEMFTLVLRWMSLTNASRDIAERRGILMELNCIVDENLRLIDELYLQVLKQTRGCPDRTVERNAWKLLAVVIKASTCSPGLTNFILSYICRIQSHLTHDPLMTKILTELTDRLRQSLRTSSCLTLSRSKTHCQLGEFYCFPVYMSDDVHVEAVYNTDTIIEEVMSQLTWTMGLPDDDSFALYECRGIRYMQIDRKRLMTSVVSDIENHRHGNEQSRLYVKKTKSSRVSSEGLDPDKIYQLYIHTKERYRHGEYPLAATGEVAARLCVYLIQAEGFDDLFGNEWDLLNKLDNFLPATSLHLKEREDWVDNVLTKYAHIGRVEAKAARLHFLDAIEGLTYRLE